MKRNTIITIAGMLFLVLTLATTGFCEQADKNKAYLIYGALVDNYVHKCEAKANMLNSGSPNIRNNALRATVKGAFLKSNRPTMIKYLMNKSAPLNAHRIEYHLTQKFTQDVRASKIYSAFVDNYIQKCEAKAKMLGSGSLNIRKNAIRATVKGAYLQSNRATMIKYLMANEAPLNAHRIEYHLTRKFTESVQPEQVYAVLSKEQEDAIH